jgi:riboflavin-specific deaminase-like protein
MESDADMAWSVIQAAAREAERLADAGCPVAFTLSGDAQLSAVPEDDPGAIILWHPEGNAPARVRSDAARQDGAWESLLPAGDPRASLLDLYLPICSATADRPITVGHLGQSLDGFIATHSGDSRWVTGQENVLHMHRLRALCDAIVVGAGTIAADDPQLTTRLVTGANPLRIVLDPARRLSDQHRVFTDDAAETWYVCARSLRQEGEHHFGRAILVGMEDAGEGGINVAELLRSLHARGCARVFVEGGGVTVSTFLEANLLDRLHVTIAPLLIGDGRPAIRLPPRAALGDCHRPRYRVFRMGGDVLFDCELRSQADDSSQSDLHPVSRVI